MIVIMTQIMTMTILVTGAVTVTMIEIVIAIVTESDSHSHRESERAGDVFGNSMRGNAYASLRVCVGVCRCAAAVLCGGARARVPRSRARTSARGRVLRACARGRSGKRAGGVRGVWVGCLWAVVAVWWERSWYV